MAISMGRKFTINQTLLGDGAPAYLIAEMSGNHAGKIDNALRIIRKAKEAGANAVKLQTYTADSITLDSNKDDFLLPKDSPWSASKNMYTLYEEAHTPWEWHGALFEEAKSIGIDIFSSVFDEAAVDLLEGLNAPAYKIASPEITDLQLIRRVAKTGKPVILSTGLSELEDIRLAISALEEGGCSEFAFLKCTTSYPAPAREANLATIAQIKIQFNCLSGLSDHTLGVELPIAAVCLGANIIEKHFTVDKSEESVDSFFSLDFDEFSAMVRSIRTVEDAIGAPSFAISESSKKNLRGRRSLYVSKDIRKGELITCDNIKSIRPSFSLHPRYYEVILNHRVKRDFSVGDRIRLEDIDMVGD